MTRNTIKQPEVDELRLFVGNLPLGGSPLDDLPCLSQYESYHQGLPINSLTF